MTAAQYLALGETPERTELVDGVVVMSPSPLPIHQLIVVEVCTQIRVSARQGGLCIAFPDTDVVFAADLVYRPDISVYRAGRFRGVPRRLDLPPDLIIEILSPSNRGLDLVTKRDDYNRFGVAEYWVIDPADASIRCWTRAAVATGQPLAPLVETQSEAQRVPSAALPGFVLDLAPIRALVVPSADA